MAVNLRITPPTPKTHPDLPLWNLGYSPEDVYDAFFPKNFRFVGNPDRPAVCGTFGRREEHLWRFEYVILPSEDANEMAKQPRATKIIFPYLTHPGHIYGLVPDSAWLPPFSSSHRLRDPIGFPVDCIDVLRSRPFTFAARSCNKWSLGRVILCGDAAHVMPPCTSRLHLI